MKREKQQDLQKDYADLGQSKLQLLLVTVLAFILFWGLVDIMEEVFEEWHWRFLPALIFFVALEGAWTTRWLRRAPHRVNRFLYRLSEIAMVIIITIIIYLVGLENQAQKEMVRSFLSSPASILNSSLLLWMAISFLAWRWSSVLTGIFNELVISNEEVAFFTTPSSERQQKGIPPVMPVYRRRLFGSYIRHWVTGGVLLAGLALLATVELSRSSLVAIQTLEFRNVSRLGLRSEHLVALVVYFTSGFWLASHARMAVMQARWIAGGRQIDPAVIHRWRRQVIIIIAVIAFSTAFLPIGSSLAISRIIRALLNTIITIFGFMLAIVPTALAWVLSFLPNVEPPLEAYPKPELEPGLPQSQVDSLNFQFPPLLLDAIFLATAVSIAILASIYFFRYRGQDFDLTYLLGIWRFLVAMVKDAWSSIINGSRELVTTVRELTRFQQVLDKIPRTSPLVLPVRAGTPTQKVRSYYLWLVKHAERQGVIRPESNSPLEYELLIVEEWPEITADFRTLTRLFMQARYSKQLLADQDARQAELLVKRLRGQIRRRLRVKTRTRD